jgi:putative salt-induced outer membrane protein YdiY
LVESALDRGSGVRHTAKGRLSSLVLAGACAGIALVVPAAADDAAPPAPTTAEQKPPDRWSNQTELSLVVTHGNSSVQTLGFKNTLEYKADAGRTRLRIDALRSDTSDDAYLQVEPGITFLPGQNPPPDFSTNAVRPGAEPDVSRFFSEARFEGNLPNKATWNTGASWDHNSDSGIVSRTIVFGGLGRAWYDRKDLVLRTTYGVSWTDRVEEVHDPEKDQKFLGARVTSDYMQKWGTVTYDNDFTFNINFKDFGDYNIDLVQGVAVNMSTHIALKVSLQLIYASEPALEEVDVIAHVIVVDPDGVPGSGDEFFETVPSGGAEIKVRDGELRREPLDTTVRTTLQINF